MHLTPYVSPVYLPGMRVRGESHMLLVGDAGVGKSQVLRYDLPPSPTISLRACI